MRRADVLERLAVHRDELRGMGVARLSLFGSFARDEADEHSDVDLLVEFDVPAGYLHLFRVQRRLVDILGRKVDLIPRDGLRPEIRDQVISEALDAA